MKYKVIETCVNLNGASYQREQQVHTGAARLFNSIEQAKGSAAYAVSNFGEGGNIRSARVVAVYND